MTVDCHLLILDSSPSLFQSEFPFPFPVHFFFFFPFSLFESPSGSSSPCFSFCATHQPGSGLLISSHSHSYHHVPVFLICSHLFPHSSLPTPHTPASPPEALSSSGRHIKLPEILVFREAWEELNLQYEVMKLNQAK